MNAMKVGKQVTDSIILRPCEKSTFSLFLSFDIRATLSVALSIAIQNIAMILTDLTPITGLKSFKIYSWLVSVSF